MGCFDFTYVNKVNNDERTNEKTKLEKKRKHLPFFPFEHTRRVKYLRAVQKSNVIVRLRNVLVLKNLKKYKK